MGEITDMILEGLLCDTCGSYVGGEGAGHPRKCEDCEIEEED